jgi:hypothetical protein
LFCFSNRTPALREIPNTTNHLNKNKNYNLPTVSMARRHCCSSLSQLDVVRCGQEVAERVKKSTSIPETKKKE